ncbi:BamA/TamA family outer membrane protein [Emticicia sp. C21]|uniref:BamA/TamA family outer membrane protein n=1 Tax=Emticicia sp. C21 TaxID=2302915 RepID=UPI000E34EDFE|nr:BamA/TamA family outer membrane protein [Emticicia sp. C21]RFS17196.1 outer membrane protein assembly factor [Emticicia sp. C21]
MNKFSFFFLLCFLQFCYCQSYAADSVFVRQVIIKGNIRTKDKIILREVGVRAGDSLRKTTINEVLEIDRRKIVNTNLFVTVNVATIHISESVIDIEIEVKERLYFVAFPVFYLADRNFNEWWYERKRDLRRTIYGVYSKHSNLTGNNDQLKLRAEFGFVPNFEIAYSTPYLDKDLTKRVSVGVLYVMNKTMAYRTSQDKLQFFQSEAKQRERLYIYSVFSQRKGFYQSQQLELSYTQVHIGDTIAVLNPNYLLDGQQKQNYFLASYAYIYDKRDNRQYALDGYTVSFGVTKYGLLPSDNIKLFSLSAGYTQYFSLGKKFYANYSVRGRMSFPKKQPFLQTLGLGYRNDLVRGYELYVIDGQSYGLVKTNLKYQLFNRTFDLKKYLKIKQFNTFPLTAYLNSFIDVGYVKNEFSALNNSRLVNKVIAGAGLGLDVVTFYNVVGRINYSLNGLGERRVFFAVTRDF